MTAAIPDLVASQLGELFVASQHGEVVRVRTPFWYPDGDVIDVFVREEGGTFTVTDLGEALGWLRLQSISDRRSPKQERLLQDIGLTLGVELFRGQIMLRCNSPAELAAAVHRVGQAALRISDLWFTTRTRTVESMTDEVADLLTEREIPFERSVRLPGRSGREWIVDFQTRTANKSALVFVLATGSRAAARQLSEHVVAGWHDLSLLRVAPQGPRFVSRIDDTSDVWSDADFRLVESISEIERWSQSSEFAERLRAA
jgi:hypothetical protein